MGRHAVRNVHVFDGERTIDAQTTVVFSDRIEWIGPSHDAPPFEDERVIDGRGCWMTPGLIDCHIHLERAPDEYVVGGVTTLRDVGNDLAAVDAIRESMAPWGAPWAQRVLRCGPLLDGPEPMWPSTSIVITDEDEVDTVVEELVARSVDAVKTYIYLSEPVHRRVVEVAHHHRLPVISHLGDVAASTAAGFGLDGIEHVTQGLYNDVVPAARRLRATDRNRLGIAPFWAAVMAGWASADPGSRYTTEVLGALAATGIALTPTLAVIEQMLDRRGPQASGIIAEDDSLNRLTAGWTMEDFARARDATAVLQATVGTFFELGGTVLAGTDNSGDLVDELRLLVTSGLPTLAALRAATSVAAESLHITDRAGRIEVGRPADLVLTTLTHLAVPRADEISRVWIDGVAVHARS